MRYFQAIGVSMAIAAAVVGLSALAGSVQEDGSRLNFYENVTRDGAIRVPDDYRTRFVHLGSYFVPDEPGAPGAGLHDVYTQRATVDAYRETGTFPDGAVLVKEVRHADAAAMTTGNAHWGADVAVRFVMVRDRVGRFADHPNFGDGWGWALFQANDLQTNVAESWKGAGFSNCFGCHTPARETDWVYVQGYPSLR